MRFLHTVPSILATVALSATVGMLSLDRDAASTTVSTERAVSTVAPSIAPTPTMTITAPAEPVEREAVDSVPAPTPTPEPVSTPEPVAAPTAPTAPTPTPEPVSTPEPLCDPEITDLHCDPETGEYYDDPPMECIPDGFLSPGAVAPVGIEPCDGLTVADTYDTNDGEFIYNPETGEVEDMPEPNCDNPVSEGILSEDGESISFCQP